MKKRENFRRAFDNFNPERLQNSAVKAYPLHNRPRGNADIRSVKFHQKIIQQKKEINPIWILKKDGKVILLDGAHRLVASHIENKKYIQIKLPQLYNKSFCFAYIYVGKFVGGAASLDSIRSRVGTFNI